MMHLDQRCSSAISPELKKPESLSLTHSSTAATSSLDGNDVHGYPFSSLGIGNSHLELSPENRRGAVLARTHSAQQHPLQFCKCGLSHCPVGAESLLRVYLGVFHGSQFSVSRANLHNTHLLLYFSLLESPT